MQPQPFFPCGYLGKKERYGRFRPDKDVGMLRRHFRRLRITLHCFTKKIRIPFDILGNVALDQGSRMLFTMRLKGGWRQTDEKSG